MKRCLPVSILNILFILFFHWVNGQHKAVITGNIESGESGYPVQISFVDRKTLLESGSKLTTKTSNGKFQIELNFDSIAYIAELTAYDENGPIKILDHYYHSYGYWDFSTAFYLLEPNDSVNIAYSKDHEIVFSGRGSGKFLYRQALSKTVNEFKKLDKIPDWKDPYAFFNWMDKLQNASEPVIEEFKKQLTPLAFFLLKTDIEAWKKTMASSFVISLGRVKNNSTGKVEFNPDSIIQKIYIDKVLIPTLTCNGPVYDSMMMNYFYKLYIFNGALGAHQAMFMWKKFPSEEFQSRYKLETYYLIQSLYSGAQREIDLANFLLLQLKATGLDSDLEYCIKDYILDKAHDEFYKSRVETSYKQTFKVLARGASVINIYNLPSSIGKRYILESFKGKVLIFDFWYTGCKACLNMVPYMDKVKNEFKDNKDVEFISISIDKNKETWLNNISRYSPGRGINLYTNGEGDRHPWIKRYQINSFPRLLLVDRNGKIYSSAPPLPYFENGANELIALIKKALKNS